jgi:tetratricopeptide (TPR) repeat protein
VDELEAALAPPKPKTKPLPQPQPVVQAQPVATRPLPAEPPPTGPHPGYARHAPRGRSRFLPVLGLLLGLALAVGAVLAFTAGGGDEPKQTAAPAKKHAKKPKAAAAAPTEQSPQPAPDEQAPAQSAPAQEPSSSGYEVPQPAGTSAAEGVDLNAQGKRLSDNGDYAGAIPVLERAARAFPAGTTVSSDLNYAYTLFNLGRALLRAGRADDAVPVLEERLKNPDQHTRVQAELDAARQQASR